MAILGQVSTGSGSLSRLYQVPKFKKAAINGIVVCNGSGADSSFSVSVAKNGEMNQTKQYLFSGTLIPANESFLTDLNLSLGPLDEVRCASGGNLISFNLFGIES